LHLIVDSNYELPVAFTVTKASEAEQPVARAMIREMEEIKPEILERCQHMSADKGYDDTETIEILCDDLDIKPVIDIRNCWKDGEDTRLVPEKENIIYNYKGDVFCVCPATGMQMQSTMAYGGVIPMESKGSLKRTGEL
jgi:hypothetical protein